MSNSQTNNNRLDIGSIFIFIDIQDFRIQISEAVGCRSVGCVGFVFSGTMETAPPFHQSSDVSPYQSLKPIPKPRKSLMNKPPLAPDLSAMTSQPNVNGPVVEENRLKEIHQQQPFIFVRPKISPPPLPPRPSPADHSLSLSSPLRMDSDTFIQPMASPDNKVVITEGMRAVQRIYPVLDAYDNKSDWTDVSSTIASSASSSEFSSQSDQYMLDMDSAGCADPFSARSSSIRHASYCEPFDGCAKSEGESICFSGWVQLPQGVFKQRKKGWALIRQNNFSIGQDEESQSPFFGPVDLAKCVYLGKTACEKTEIVLIIRSPAKGKSQKALLSTLYEPTAIRFIPEENAEHWLSLLAKCCSPRNDLFKEQLPLIDCCGKLWIKQGISGHWNEGWAYAQKRILSYWLQGPNSISEVDIRKIFLVKQNDIPLSDWCNHIEHSSSGPLLISLEGNSLYLQSEFDQCTSNWLKFLLTELKRDASTLEECRLTPYDVPVIVDKCINLVSTYGLNQPGIYRKNGSAAEVKRIIQQFREDPYNVQLKPPITDETINAIADVLRTFFRQLKVPLIPVSMHSQLYEISTLLPEQKTSAYKKLIDTLGVVHYRTLKKLLGHLQEVVSIADRNLASLENITKVFGPNLFNISNPDETVSFDFYSTATKQALVLHDLIFYFCEIFEVKAEELLEKSKLDLIREQKTAKNPATGLLISIHLFERDNKCFNVQSEWTASQVVSFKIQKLAFVSPCENYALFEVVKGGQLERRIGGNETMRSIVLGRWMDWEDSSGNFLLLKKDTHPFQPQSGRAFAENIRITEPGSRSFKPASLRIEDGIHVCHYSRGLKLLARWKVDGILWFCGAESERRCPFPFALTFFVAGKGEKREATGCKGKFSGYCAAFKDELQRMQWLNQVIVSAQEYLPMPIIQI